jgi:hypothetical protein
VRERETDRDRPSRDPTTILSAAGTELSMLPMQRQPKSNSSLIATYGVRDRVWVRVKVRVRARDRVRVRVRKLLIDSYLHTPPLIQLKNTHSDKLENNRLSLYLSLFFLSLSVSHPLSLS